MDLFLNYILLFFAFAFLGWCIEVTLKYFQYHRFINRGFLTGPWLPIYGTGAVLITAVVGDLSRFESAVGTTFIISFILCGTLEYMASFYMEKRYHARWWDYSSKPMNLNGRVWIGNLILFGLGGILIIHVFNPVFFSLFRHMSFSAREITAAILSAVFTADFVVSHFVLKLVKTGVEHSEADSTEEISKEVRLLLSDRSVFYRRFAEAYPDVIYKTERITKRMEELRAETERLRQEATRRLSDAKQELAANLEPAVLVKNSLIDKQGELIDMLYDEEKASDEMKMLKREIDAKSAQLDKRRTILPKLVR